MKTLLRIISAMLAIAILPCALAQTPAAPYVRFVLPTQPGGALDPVGRYFGNKLSERIGVPVIVDFKPGATGIIGAQAVAVAPADGKTLLLATGGSLTIAPHLRKAMPYDAERDFVPVAMMADMPMSLAVRADSPYTSVADVLREAKAKPGKVAMGNTGVASISHLTGELLGQATGVTFLHVPYQGVPPATVDLMGGQLDVLMTSSIALESLVQANKVRVLATFSKQRLPSSGRAPTMTEAVGLSGLEVPVWLGLLAPAKTPAKDVETIAALIVEICKLPETQERFKEIIVCAGPQEFGAVMKDDYRRWGETIRRANIQAQ